MFLLFSKKNIEQLPFLLCCRQGNCRKVAGNQDGFRRMRMVVIDIWESTGKQEKKGIGMEFLIYLARAAIHLHVLLKNRLSCGLICSSFFFF